MCADSAFHKNKAKVGTSMNGLNKITERIAADAEADNRILREETEKRCEEIRSANKKKAQEEYLRVIQEGELENGRRAASIERTARLEARKSVLAMKQELVSKAFDLAKARLAALPEQKYIGFLSRLAEAAAITGEEEIILNSMDRARCGTKIVRAANELLKKSHKHYPHLTLSEEVREMSGGLVLKQGDIEVNCTIDMLLDINREELSSEVAGALFDS